MSNSPPALPVRRRDVAVNVVIALLLGSGLTGCRQPGPAEWLAELKSGDAAIRQAAAERLALAAPTSPEVVTALTAATADADPDVRRWACRGLGQHKATGSVKDLEQRLKDPATAVRRAAAFALEEVAPESRAWRDELILGMKMGDGGLLVAVKSMEPRPTWAIPVLIDLAKDKRAGIRRLAIEALAVVGAGDDTARKAIESARRDPDDRVREAADEALKSR